MCEASSESVVHLKGIMRWFGAISGLYVNFINHTYFLSMILKMSKLLVIFGNVELAHFWKLIYDCHWEQDSRIVVFGIHCLTSFMVDLLCGKGGI